MPPTKPSLSSYYYGFTETGVEEIDLILSAVAYAGRAFHHTDQWQEDCTPYPGHTGTTPEEWIQNAANRAAEKFRMSNPNRKEEPSDGSTSLNRDH
jgi:hypothetical protein